MQTVYDSSVFKVFKVILSYQLHVLRKPRFPVKEVNWNCESETV